MSQVGFGRGKELLLVVACELRPALAIGDSPVPVVDFGHLALVFAVQTHRLRPAEHVAAFHLGVHWTLTM